MSRQFKTGKKNRTRYIYYGVDGSKTILTPGEDGVTEMMIKTLHGFDDKEYNNDRSETRKHMSLQVFKDKNKETIDFDADLDEMLVLEFEGIERNKCLHRALMKMKPKQRDLIQKLYLSEDTMSQKEYAQECGIAESSVSQNAWRAREKLKEFLEAEKNNL